MGDDLRQPRREAPRGTQQTEGLTLHPGAWIAWAACAGMVAFSTLAVVSGVLFKRGRWKEVAV